jgi:2-oxoisovalerate dehydrogenase E1 component
MTLAKEKINEKIAAYKQEVLNDFKLVALSREASLLGRKEVLTGKAKFGIFGDGKELAQAALAKQFENGDFRSGYYRDQTLMLAIGQTTIQKQFAGLYAHTDTVHEPASAGRQMGSHFATRSLNDDGTWKVLTDQKNSSADISPTAGQMPRLLGLAQASKVFRTLPDLKDFTQFSKNGNEIAWGTIGDASTSEGLFWETMNAAGVMQVPMVMSVWDDGYGISVPKKFQTTKANISEALAGFQRTADSPGFEILKTKGWDYPHLCLTYAKAAKIAREEHVPVLVHVEEVTQPQGHSTSGSHERYKSAEVLAWSEEYDCLNQFRKWIITFEKDGETIATEAELDAIVKEAKKEVRTAQKEAWSAFLKPMHEEATEAIALLENLTKESVNGAFIGKCASELTAALDPTRKDVFVAIRKALRYTRGETTASKTALINWLDKQKEANKDRYNSLLYSESAESALHVNEVAPTYDDAADMVDGRLVLRNNFETIFNNNPLVLTFGEDTGKIGGVNQSMEGMQDVFGVTRVADTGIREATILGQGIGMAMRGLRPIAEIQYLDYLLYAIQIMSDDLATVQYRTKGGQKAPLIVRTRGHRLEGIWHSGSPMGMIINAIRGIYVCVPRNMVTAAGFYNTLLKSDDPALVIEPLNGYRSKEKLPTNLGEFTVPLGIPEITKTGTDITLVSYGSTFNLCTIAAQQLMELGISVELVDVRTLIPFDINGMINESLKKTNRLMIVDEDVSSGASAYILDKVLTEQKGYYQLDSEPITIAAKDHRPAYGTDGDYYSKPSIDDVVEAAYAMMHEAKPKDFPSIY